jgi:hypothetical protein
MPPFLSVPVPFVLEVMNARGASAILERSSTARTMAICSKVVLWTILIPGAVVAPILVFSGAGGAKGLVVGTGCLLISSAAIREMRKLIAGYERIRYLSFEKGQYEVGHLHTRVIERSDRLSLSVHRATLKAPYARPWAGWVLLARCGAQSIYVAAQDSRERLMEAGKQLPSWFDLSKAVEGEAVELRGLLRIKA